MNTWSTCRGNSGFTFSTVSAGLVFSLQLFSIFFQGLYPARRPENPIHEGKVERRFWDSAAYVDLDPHEWTLSMAEFDKMIDRVVESDILVVGGGGAGASAAIAAARGKCKVTLAAKGALGISGNTVMSSAAVGMDGESAFRYGEKKADRSFTKDLLFEKIVRHGYYLSEQALAEQYVETAGPRVHELLEWCKRAKQRFIFVPPGSWFTSGKAIGLGCRLSIGE